MVGGLEKYFFCDMSDLCHSRRGRYYELTLPTPPYTLLFNGTFYFIVGDSLILIRGKRLLALISHLVPLSLRGMQPAWSWSFCDFSPLTPWPVPVEHSIVQIPSDPSNITYLG